MKILVIEDNAVFSDLLCEALRDAGYEAHAAYSGTEGVKTALALAPDLVMLDYHLGDMTGYDAALALRCMRATAGTPFLVLSSLGADPLLVGGFKKMALCRAVLVKTMPLPEILAAVGKALVR